MPSTNKHKLKYGIAAVTTACALILLLGPTWVQPIDHVTGQPYTTGTPHGPQNALAVFILCLGLWVTNVIPLPATSLLAIALLPTLGILPQAQAFGYFGNSATFFLLGVFILAAAMIDTGLSKRLTLRFLHWFDRTPARLVAGVLICGSFFSLWMPEHAVAAMMYPIVLEIAEALKLRRPGSIYARSVFLALAWGPVVGGVGTYLGGARAVLAIELLRKFEPAAAAPSFLEYAAIAMPLVILMTFATYYIITLGAHHEIDSVAPATRMLAARVRELGPLSSRERRLAWLSVVTVVSWIFLPQLSERWFGWRIEISVVAVLSAVAIFALGIVKWKKIQGYVNWGVLVMYGGAVALGAAVADTHAMEWCATRLVPHMATGPILLLTTIAIVSVVLTEAMSNAAVVSLLLPVGFGLCHQLGVSPLAMLFMITLPAGLGFCLPMGAPPIAIAFSAGYYSVGSILSRGIIMNVLAIILLVLIAWLYWPLVGLPL